MKQKFMVVRIKSAHRVMQIHPINGLQEAVKKEKRFDIVEDGIENDFFADKHLASWKEKEIYSRFIVMPYYE